MESSPDKKQSVLILGASLMQKPAILCAREEGLKVFVVDANPSSLCVPLADSFEKIDLKDREKILDYARVLKKEEGLLGIFTAGTDFSASVSYASEKLGFHSHSFESTLNASEKQRMRGCFERANLPSPRFFSAETEEDALVFAEKLGFPCVVKPTDNMGARGCRLVRNLGEAESSIKNAFKNSRGGRVIIEEYMEGPEFSIDAIVYNGTMTVTGFADRHIHYEPYFIETGHTMPSVFDEKKRLELVSVFAKAVNALGLTEGAAKADIKYTEKGPRIGEVAARLSGGYMSGWTFPYSSGLNLTAEALKIAVGRKPDVLLEKRIPLEAGFSENSFLKENPFELFEVRSCSVSAERAWISIPGRISTIIDVSDKKDPFLRDFFPRGFKAGDIVDFPRNNVQKCGNSISLSDDYDEAVSSAEKSSGSQVLVLEKNNCMTDDFLNGRALPDEEGFPPPAFSSYEEVKDFRIEGTIGAGESVLSSVPDCVAAFLALPEKNWNYRTALEEAELFDRLAGIHGEVSKDVFWKALFRGGIQGALYVS